ncbi:LOW QUALITY PROTEIN: uncharacterized protein [Chlorocebus sabaeus]|uniref:LOW QUALITY PROTEIN: uncharacterized protein n=1 Tax=Chlorocebus sabaeus TaxID=60711 RepID=UPI003BF9FB6E
MKEKAVVKTENLKTALDSAEQEAKSDKEKTQQMLGAVTSEPPTAKSTPEEVSGQEQEPNSWCAFHLNLVLPTAHETALPRLRPSEYCSVCEVLKAKESEGADGGRGLQRKELLLLHCRQETTRKTWRKGAETDAGTRPIRANQGVGGGAVSRDEESFAGSGGEARGCPLAQGTRCRRVRTPGFQEVMGGSPRGSVAGAGLDSTCGTGELGSPPSDFVTHLRHQTGVGPLCVLLWRAWVWAQYRAFRISSAESDAQPWVKRIPLFQARPSWKECHSWSARGPLGVGVTPCLPGLREGRSLDFVTPTSPPRSWSGVGQSRRLHKLDAI